MTALSLISISAKQKSTAIVVFAVVFGLLITLANWALIEFDSRQRYFSTFFMLVPAIAGLAAAASIRLPLTALGMKLAPGKSLVTSYCIPALYGILAYVPIWLFFSNGYGSPKAAETIGEWLGIIGWSDSAIFVLFTILMMTIGVALQLLPTLGIELGFRGFLAPLIMPHFGFMGAAIITGLLYAAMHAPIILWADYNAGPKGLGLQMGSFTITSISLSVAGLYYRLKTGSILPGALFHASHIALILFALSEATSKSQDTWRYGGEFGIMVPVVLIPVAFFFYQSAKRRGYTTLSNS